MHQAADLEILPSVLIDTWLLDGVGHIYWVLGHFNTMTLAMGHLCGRINRSR
eukprot:COSAG02_NODE_30015_length_558_cov_2.867102_1_plen_51_part_10